MAARSQKPSRTSGGGGPDGVKLGRLGPRHLALAMGAILLAWLILIVTGIGQEFPNDYAAFYAMARGLRIYGLGLDSRLYSVPVQYALESFIRNRAGATLAIHLSITNLDQVSSQLMPLYGEDCPVIVVFRASWPDERVLRGTLSTIREVVQASGVDRNALILVGKSLDQGPFGESYLYSAARDRAEIAGN